MKLFAVVSNWPKWRTREKGRGCAEEEVCAERGERARQVCYLLLHPSVLKVQVEPYSLALHVCVKRGAGRKGSEKKGVERCKGRDGRGRKGGWVGGCVCMCVCVGGGDSW